MSSKAAINTDTIIKSLSAGDPTRPWSHNKPDFKLKRFEEVSNQFGSASQCAGGGDGGITFSNGFK